MKLGPPLLALLDKQYPPSRMVEATFKRYDLAFKTNENGIPILLYIGKKTSGGKIKGYRFSRNLLFGPSGEKLKDHWDNKGAVQ